MDGGLRAVGVAEPKGVARPAFARLAVFVGATAADRVGVHGWRAILMEVRC